MGKFLEMSLVTVALVCLLNASGAWSLADPGVFLNINCGASLDITDPTTNLVFHGDSSYITTGETSTKVAPFLGYPQLDTLRYFNDTRFPKYCYQLPVESNSTYMLRAIFYYGVYDNANSVPTFLMTIDGLPVANVTNTIDTAYYYELTYLAQGNTTYLCLLRDQSNSNPFISSIELRRVIAYPDMYDSHLSQGFMASTTVRYSFGSSSVPRYPDDIYDRYWTSVNETGESVLTSPSPLELLNTTRQLVYAGGNPDYVQVPQMVLQSALASNASMNLTMADTYDTGFLFLHFAELDPLVNVTSRVFTVTVSPGYQAMVNPLNQSLALNGDAIGWIFDDMTLDSTMDEIVQFVPTSYSVYGPMINAAEFFEYVPGTAPLKTLNVDALAVDGIKSSLNLLQWTGDPCVPVPHTWLNCSTANPPTIESVNLANYSLAGTIPLAFAKLQSLTTLILSDNQLVGDLPDLSPLINLQILILSDNQLVGDLPDLSPLINLQILHLQDNNLTGPLPGWLGNLTSLTELYVQNNNFTGAIPPALNRTGLKFTHSPGNLLLGPVQGLPADHPHKTNIWVIVGPVLGGGVTLIAAVIFIVVYFCVCKKRRSRTKDVSGSSAEKAVVLVESRVPNTGGARSFSVAEITKATGNFRREIGKGGFGSVYYGKLPNGSEVAVKVLASASRNQVSNQGASEFFNEVDVLSRVHHRNLVSLLGFCNERENQMLVYEYLPQGSLRDRLNASGRQEAFDFKARLNVALNAAQGLEYLHAGCNPCIVHRDVKSSNILLTDTKDVAKVADFGMSRLAPGEEDGSLTIVKGSRGYIDPEYMTTHYLTAKSDVYSFGVVLLELLTGRVPLPSTSQPQSDFAWTLCDWVRNNLQSDGDPEKILDPRVSAGHPDKEAVWKVTNIAMMCVEPKSIHRPTMAEVVHELRAALTIEQGKSGLAFTTPSSSDIHSVDFSSNDPSLPAPR